MKTKNPNRLPRPMLSWIEAALHNDKGYADLQTWRVDEMLDGRWSLFQTHLLYQGLILEQQMAHYRLTPISAQILINNR